MKRLLLLALIGIGGLLSCKQEVPPATVKANAGVWTTDAKRTWAANLRDAGLDEQAIVVYEDLIAQNDGLSQQALLGTSVVVAEIHMKKGRYQEALASLLRAGQLNPEGDLARKINTWRITCLERLGRSDAADRLLDRASALGTSGNSNATPDGVVVAKIAGEDIYLSELETLIAQQSPELQERISSKGGKLELLKNLVAQRVLERKARKLGLQEDDKVQLAIDLATREILVRKLMSDEVKSKVAVKEEDAKLYYEANKERFREPHQVDIAQIVVQDLAEEQKVREALKTANWNEICQKFSRDGETRETGGRLKETVVEGQSHGEIYDVQGLFAAIGDTKAGAIAPKSTKTSSGRHIIKVLKRKDGRTLPFDQVKDVAMRMLAAERERAAVAEIMQKALKQSDVKIFEDKLGQ